MIEDVSRVRTWCDDRAANPKPVIKDEVQYMATSATSFQSPSARKGTLGRMSALILTTAMIVGTGLFTSLGAAAAHAHSGLLVAMLIGGFIVLLTGTSAAQVGVNYPEEGGAFIWMRIFGHPTLSFIAGISYLIEGTVGLAIISLGFAKYSAEIFHGLPVPIAASVALLAVAALNSLGISPTSKVMIGVFVLNLLILGLYVGLAVHRVRLEHLTPVLGRSLSGVLGGAATFFWTWDGFQRTAIMANEIKEPRRTIPFAVVGGILIAALVYVVIAGTTLGVLGPTAMGKSDTPLFRAASVAIAGWGIWLVLSSAWMLTFSEMLGDMLSTSRVGHAMGQEHELPHLIGTVHKRLKSPQASILLLTAVALILVNLIRVRRLMPLASACTLVWYATTNFAALKLTKEQRLPWASPVISWLGIAACLALFFALPRWSILAAFGVLALFTAVRFLVIRAAEKEVADAGGNWTVSGLALSEGDTISVTAQYAGETASTATTTTVAAAPRQTVAPVLSGAVTAADTTVSGKAPSGANVVLSVNGVAQTAVVANGGNWTVAGLTLSPGDSLSVTAQSPGETVSIPAIAVVAPDPPKTVEPQVSGIVYETPTAQDTTVSGTAPPGARVVLSVNGVAQPPVLAKDGKWTVTGLNLAPGDSLSVTAQAPGQAVSAGAITTVAAKPLKTGEPIISRIVTAADSTVSGTAPPGASVVLSVNGVARPAVVATEGKTVSAATTTMVAPAPPQTAPPVISGIVKAGDKTVSGTAPPNASVVLSVNSVAQPAVTANGGNWMVSGLNLASGTSISVTAQSAGEAMSSAATTTVQ